MGVANVTKTQVGKVILIILSYVNRSTESFWVGSCLKHIFFSSGVRFIKNLVGLLPEILMPHPFSTPKIFWSEIRQGFREACAQPDQNYNSLVHNCFGVVTQYSSQIGGGKRCVTTLMTAAKESKTKCPLFFYREIMFSFRTRDYDDPNLSFTNQVTNASEIVCSLSSYVNLDPARKFQAPLTRPRERSNNASTNQGPEQFCVSVKQLALPVWPNLPLGRVFIQS